MDVKKLALLVGALVIAVVTAVMARNMFAGAGAQQAAAAPAVPVGPKVLVAKTALPVGTIIDADSLTFQPWPKELMQSAYYVEGQPDGDPKKLLGTVVRYAVTAGQPVTQGSLVKPGDRGFLAAALGPGMRAVSVPVSGPSAVAGFVFPGDHVDLVLTQSVPGGGDGPPLKASETIIRNLRVLATDQRTDNQVGDDGKTVVKGFSNVTVEATPKIAEEIAVARTVGELSLSLRSLADDQSQLEAAIASGQVSVSNDPKAEKEMLARADTAPSAGPGSYATGADVSRFQRSTVPGKADSGNSQGDGAAAPTGPVVRVARGDSVTLVPVGGK